MIENTLTRRRVAIVVSDVFLRRLTPGLFPFVRSRQDYSIINIHRPIREIINLIKVLQPVGLLTEALPQKTEPLLRLGLPTVIADSDRTYPGAISLDVDDWKIGERAASYFLDAGFRQFAFFGNLTDYSRQRQAGFIQQLRKHRMKCKSHVDDEHFPGGYMEFYRGPTSKLKAWLLRLPRPVGLFAAHDPLGRLACEVCLECGLSVPEEVAVVGANNDELVCNLSYPSLSSVAIPWSLIGKRVGELMDGLIIEKKNIGKVFHVEPQAVVVRESSNLTAVDDLELRRALEYLRQHYQEPISLKSVCAALRINRRTLELKCRKYLGRTPRTELVRLRIEKAKDLLVQTESKIDWIAQQCGFADAERLSVVFRSVTGKPPSVYRKQYR